MNSQSQQIPALVMPSIDRGRSGIVGEGKNIWPNVQINDGECRAADTTDLLLTSAFRAVNLYGLIWNATSGGEDVGHGRQGFYFAENGEHHLYDIGRAIGAVPKDFRLVEEAEPSSFTTEELEKYFDGVSTSRPIA